MTHVSAAFTQNGFRARNDDGTQTTATWIAATNTDWSQDVDTTFRLRFEILETAGGSANLGGVVEYQVNGGGYATVTASTPVKLTSSGTVTDATATTQQISSGTFVAGEFDSNGVVGNISFNGNDRTEMEYCLTLDSAQISDADVVDIRVAGLNTYTVANATVTALKANTGVFSKTLDDATLSADASAIAGASAAITWEDFTVSADTVPSIANANGAITTDDATISSDASTTVSADANIALDDASTTSTASLSAQADLSITWDNFTVTASIPEVLELDYYGSTDPYGVLLPFASYFIESGDAVFLGNITLADASLSADASLLAQAALSIAVDDFTLSSDASLLALADSAVTLDDATVSADASLLAAADAAITLDGATMSADASAPVTADTSLVWDDFTVTSTGESFIAADVSVVLGDAVISSDASLAANADVAITLDDASLSSDAGLLGEADSSLVLDGITLTSDAGLLAQADAAFTWGDAVVDSTLGIGGVAADAVITLADAVISSDITTTLTANGSITLEDASISSGSSVPADGDVSITTDDFAVSSSVGLLVTSTVSFTVDDFGVHSELELNYVGAWFGLGVADNEWECIDDQNGTVWYLNTQSVEIPTYGMAESYGDTAFSTLSELEIELNISVPTPLSPVTEWEDV